MMVSSDTGVGAWISVLFNVQLDLHLRSIVENKVLVSSFRCNVATCLYVDVSGS